MKRKKDESGSRFSDNLLVEAPDGRRPYERMSIVPILSAPEYSMLASSTDESMMIESVGQELGPAFDYSQTTDINTGKDFNHEWL